MEERKKGELKVKQSQKFNLKRTLTNASTNE